MFIPYRPRLKLIRFPVLTLLVTIACIAIYWNQANNEKEVFRTAAQFCTDDVARDIEDIDCVCREQLDRAARYGKIWL